MRTQEKKAHRAWRWEKGDRMERCFFCTHGTYEGYGIINGKAEPLNFKCARETCKFESIIERGRNYEKNRTEKRNTGIHDAEEHAKEEGNHGA